jgi:hypothetical protein
MKPILLSCALLGIAVPAYAQAPKFAPIAIDEATYNSLHTHLEQQPYKFAFPLLQWLDALEAKALAEQAKAAAPDDKPTK